MCNTEAVLLRVAAENDALRLGIVAAISENIRRRMAIRGELRQAIGLDNLVEHPDEEAFYQVLKGIQSIITQTAYDNLFLRTGFEGASGAEWHGFSVGSAPERSGRHVLEILFEKAMEEFCGGDVKWQIHGLPESASVLVEEALSLVENASIVQTVIPALLTTKLNDIPDWHDVSVRLRNAMKNDSVEFFGDILEKSEREHLRAPNFGMRTLSELKEFVKRHGHVLLPQWSTVHPPEVIAFIQWRDAQDK